MTVLQVPYPQQMCDKGQTEPEFLLAPTAFCAWVRTRGLIDASRYSFRREVERPIFQHPFSHRPWTSTFVVELSCPTDACIIEGLTRVSANNCTTVSILHCMANTNFQALAAEISQVAIMCVALNSVQRTPAK